MLDKKFLLNNRDVYENTINRRGGISDYDSFIQLNNEYLELKKKYDDLRSKQKKITSLNDESLQLKQELNIIWEKFKKSEELLNNWLLNQPNILLSDVPDGVSDADNLVVYETEIFEKESVPNYELIDDFIMEKESANLSGSRFVICRQKLSELKRALVNFMLDHNKENGYKVYDVPYIVNESAFYAAGQFPKFKEEAFELTNGQWLISTGEVSLVSMFCNTVFEENDLPRLCTTYSPCFRKEAGSAGKDMKGLIRLHQFHKVELVSICKPEDAEYYHEKQRKTAENILNALHIPYRVVSLCSGDIGFTSCKTYDIEVWLPGSKRYLEVASCSQCGEFQARRAGIKYKNGDKIEYVHTLNGSSLPIERLLVAIIENHYDKETHSIIIPNILRDYLKKNQISLNKKVEVDF